MVKVKTDFNVNFNPKTVMQMINCTENSNIYNDMLEEFSDLAKDSIKKIKPIALMKFGEIPKEIANDDIKEGTKALFVLISVGDELSKSSTKAFEEGDYVSGLMLDVMADDVLFQLDGLLKKDIISICKEKKYGIKQRLEPPNNIDISAQKTVWEITDALNIANIQIKDSFMFDPVKTIALVYVLEEACENFNVSHSCEKCTSYNCPFRKSSPKKITVLLGESKREIFVLENQSLMDALIDNEIYVPAICGGRGTCGKCKVNVIDGNVPITQEDKKFFSEGELANGMRLSCKAFPQTDCIISLSQSENTFDVLTSYSRNYAHNKSEAKTNNNSLKVVVDIGTTTIAMQLISDDTGESLDTFTAINRQRAFGADVISRIQASNDGNLETLKKIIRDELLEGLKAFNYKNRNISQIVLAGNTTMVHIFMGYSCKTLGIYPFDAFNLNIINTTFEGIPLIILPGISTFVGADITSGILASNMDTNEKICILIDLGTNGEMVIGNKDKLLVTATAAGPAFEGGNICCGTGSVAGAICNVSMKDKKVCSIKTIGDKPLVGICGTGIVEIVSEMLRENIIDETGLFDDEYFDDGFTIGTSKDGDRIYFTQKDIREIQLAKSAVRAGIEILLLRYGVTSDDIDKVYLAGGFGYRIDVGKAIEIGMFPEKFSDKIVTVGNSSLNGCVRFATDNTLIERTNRICELAQEINLSSDKVFNDLYTKYMYFNEEEIEEEL